MNFDARKSCPASSPRGTEPLQVCKARVTWSMLGEACLPTSHTRLSNASQPWTQSTASKRTGVSQTCRGAGSQYGHFCGDSLPTLSYTIALFTCEKWHWVSCNINKNIFTFWADSYFSWHEWNSANRHCHLLAPRPSTDFPTNTDQSGAQWGFKAESGFSQHPLICEAAGSPVPPTSHTYYSAGKKETSPLTRFVRSWAGI